MVEGLTYLSTNAAGREAGGDDDAEALLRWKEHIEDLEDFQRWHEVVERGSNVFLSPGAFPEAFCRAAGTLDRGLRTRLGRSTVARVLDCLPFFEFNRRRGLPESWHRRVNRFGLPVQPAFQRLEALASALASKAEAATEGSDGGSEGGAAEPAPSALPSESCWADEEPGAE